MDKYSEKILKYLNKNSSKDNPLINDELYNSIPYDRKTIESSIKQLISENKIVNNTRPYFVSDTIMSSSVSYYPTTIGKNYFKDKYISKIINGIKVFVRSIFFPILVSIVTTLLTLLINNLLSK
ncbi:MAG: hypothetical protein HFJ12_01370 [Bacilli bacterium]|nr:hypothetical protein [Bacilli bacterium]